MGHGKNHWIQALSGTVSCFEEGMRSANTHQSSRDFPYCRTEFSSFDRQRQMRWPRCNIHHYHRVGEYSQRKTAVVAAMSGSDAAAVVVAAPCADCSVDAEKGGDLRLESGYELGSGHM